MMRRSKETGLGRLALEGKDQCVVQVGILFVEGGEIGTQGAKGFESGGGWNPAGDFLFNLRYAHGLFSDVVGEQQPEQIAGQRSATSQRQHGMMGQMQHSSLDTRPVRNRCGNSCGKLAAMQLAGWATSFEHLVFGYLVPQRRNIEYLACLDRYRLG